MLPNVRCSKLCIVGRTGKRKRRDSQAQRAKPKIAGGLLIPLTHLKVQETVVRSSVAHVGIFKGCQVIARQRSPRILSENSGHQSQSSECISNPPGKETKQTIVFRTDVEHWDFGRWIKVVTFFWLACRFPNVDSQSPLWLLARQQSEASF